MLQSPVEYLPSSLTIGEYERVPDVMMRPGASLISHRIAGSFHWQLKFNYIRFGESKFGPSISTAFLDSGSTLILMPMQDWDSLFKMICDDYGDAVQCYTTRGMKIM